MWINREKCEKHMKLDLGSGDPDQGENQPDEFVLNDISPHKNIDLVCDIRDILKYVPEGYCSIVRMSHVLEHFTIKERIKILNDIHKILENNGELIIIVPNFKWHAELVTTGNDKMAVLYAFGGQLDEYDLHKTGYTVKILRKRLEENGFKIISIDDNTSIECHSLKTST